MSISSISWLFNKCASVTPAIKRVKNRMQLVVLYQARSRRLVACFALETYSQGMRIYIKTYLNLLVKAPVSVVVKNRSGALVSD